ncbi:MAG: glycoside hydrolase family 3 N-terminal domain-containing protein, partial [Burkholderiaceae bacterium]
AEADSHVDLPTDTRSRKEILRSDAAPYRWLGPLLAGVMPAHVVYSDIDSIPAGFSRRWIVKMLRRELGFTGAVFSDDLLMEGARTAGTVSECAAHSLDAGCDFVLVCNDMDAITEVLQMLQWERSAVFASRVKRLWPRGPALTVDELRSDESYRRSLRDIDVLRA